MRHQRRKRVNLNRGRRAGVFNSLLKGLIIHGKVKASTARVKQIQVLAEKIITMAKEDSLASRRRIFSYLQDETMVKKLMSEIAPRYQGRNGGYTQLFKLGPRQGDGCELSQLTFLP
jgi:large subunit ribosomal protein L17